MKMKKLLCAALVLVMVLGVVQVPGAAEAVVSIAVGKTEVKKVDSTYVATNEITFSGDVGEDLTAESFEMTSAADGERIDIKSVTKLDNATYAITYDALENGGACVLETKGLPNVTAGPVYVDSVSYVEGTEQELCNAAGDVSLTEYPDLGQGFMGDAAGVGYSGVLTVEATIEQTDTADSKAVMMLIKGLMGTSVERVAWRIYPIAQTIAGRLEYWKWVDSDTKWRQEGYVHGVDVGGDRVMNVITKIDMTRKHPKLEMTVDGVSQEEVELFDSGYSGGGSAVTNVYFAGSAGSHMLVRNVKIVHNTCEIKPMVASVEYLMTDNTAVHTDARKNVDPADVKGLRINFTDAITEELSAGSIGVGELDTSKFTGELSENKKSYTVEFKQRLKPMTSYNLTIPAVDTEYGKTAAYGGVLKTGEGGLYADSLTVNNTSVSAKMENFGGSGNVTLCYALYDGENNLVGLDFDTKTYTETDETLNISVTVSGYEEGYTVKGFLFEDFDNIALIADSETYPETASDGVSTVGDATASVEQKEEYEMTFNQPAAAGAGCEYAFAAFYPGKTASDLASNAPNQNAGVIAYFGSAKTDENGKYTLTVPMEETDPTGEYNVLVAGDGVSEDIAFTYRAKDDWILYEVNNADGSGALEALIEEYAEYLQIDASGTSVRAYQEMTQSYESLDALKHDFKEKKKMYPVSVGESEGSGNSVGSNGSGGAVIRGDVTIRDEGTTVDSVPETLNRYVFDDVDGVEWARDAICGLAEMGVLAGKAPGLFFPDDLVTREEFVKMIVTAFGIDAENPNCPLGDVDKNEWYYPFVAKAYTSGIVKGDGKVFGVGSNITRQDLAVMAYNAAEAAGVRFDEADGAFMFDDDERISDYARTAVYCLRNEGVVNGVDNRNYAPMDKATRAQAAKIIYMLIGMVE